MADDHYSRPPRPSNPLARPQSERQAPPSGDPLAELARLIGQSDPYGDYGRNPPRSGGNGSYPDYAQDTGWRAPGHAQHPQSYAPQDDYRDGGYNANASYAPPFSSYPDSSYAAPDAAGQDYDRHYGEANYSHGGYSQPHYGDAHGDAHDAGGAPQAYAPDRYAAQSYPQTSQPDPHYPTRAHDPRFVDPPAAVPQFASPQFDDKPYPPYDNRYYDSQPAPFPPALGDPQVASYYPAPHEQDYSGAPYGDGHAPAYGAPYYDPAPEAVAPSRRRGGLVTVLAVMALAVVGTAAAFGYRAIFAPGGARVPPPVIKADTTPSKIVPASDKPIQDRVGERAQIERIINREEQPVDVNTAQAGAPRVVFPGPNPIAPLPNSPIPPSPAAQAPTQTGSAPVAASTEPKKIRTVTIRSDQPELAAAASAAAAAASSAPRPNVPSGTLPPENPRNVASAPAAASSSGPLSLSPSTVQSAQQRTAPVRTAAAPAATAGGYSVQVTSQRSEGEAQAAYAALQAKFPSVLGNRQALIRRADLGEKGIYYRAQIPFASQSEAADFCASLRNAGGQCVVQRN